MLTLAESKREFSLDVISWPVAGYFFMRTLADFPSCYLWRGKCSTGRTHGTPTATPVTTEDLREENKQLSGWS
jgi:hypothetical protein